MDGQDLGAPEPVVPEPAAAPTVLTGDAILGKLLQSSFKMGAEAFHAQPVATALCLLVPTLLYMLTSRRGANKGGKGGSKEMPPPEPELTPEYEPVQLGELTEEQLAAYDGSKPGKATCVAIKGKIYDCTKGVDFYGPGGSYHLFAGKDSSRALAKMSFKPEDLNGNIEGLTASETDILLDWEKKFDNKYPVVGSVTSFLSPAGARGE